MIVQKLDFSTWIDFTQNIDDDQINPYIIKTDTKKILPALGDDLHAAIRLISDENPIAWSSTTAYSVNDYATSGDVVYKAIQAGTNHAVTDTAYWEESPLGTFWLVYVKPWAVHEIAQKFFIWHGINTTQFGVRVNFSDSDTSIDGKTREAIIADLASDAGMYKSKMLNYLEDEEWTIDGVEYEVDCTDYKNEPSFSIRPVGKRKTYTDQ